MPSNITPRQLGKAVLDHVQDGTYPDSEDIISAEFPPSAIPEALKLVDNAREQIKVPNSPDSLELRCSAQGCPRLGSRLQARAVPRTPMAGSRKPSSYGTTSKQPRNRHRTYWSKRSGTNSCGGMSMMRGVSFDCSRKRLPSTKLWQGV